MANKQNNISRYLQISDAILLEYIINNDYINGEVSDSNDNKISSFPTQDTLPIIYNIINGNGYNRLMVEQNNVGSNNTNTMTAIPIDKEGSKWVKFNNPNDIKDYCVLDEDGNKLYNIPRGNTNIPYDTIRLHVLSGYSFTDITGFLLRVKTKNNKGEDIYLASWLFERDYKLFNYEKMMIINDRVYDKYIDLKIPSMKALKSYEFIGDNYKDGQEILDILDIKNGNLSDIELIYSSIDKDSTSVLYNSSLERKASVGFEFVLDDEIKVSIPYDSPADRFNIHLAEASDGEYLTFYGTWDNYPLTYNIISKFGNQIKIASSNNDNYDEESLYYADAGLKSNWVVNHEIISTMYKIPSEDSGKNVPETISTETYTVTQDFSQNMNEKLVFYYKPVLHNNIINSKIDFITFDYTCRLINRYNGSQIVRKGALTTYNVNRYIQGLSKIAVKQINPYTVFNKIEKVTEQINTINSPTKTKYTKVFYDISNINVEMNDSNSTYYIPENSFILNMYRFEHNYKMRFSAFDNESQAYKNINLNDMSSYALRFTDENDKIVEIPCTYSNNMNLTLGELEFKISTNNSRKMEKLPDNKKIISIIVKNLDGSISTLFECKYTFDWHK